MTEAIKKFRDKHEGKDGLDHILDFLLKSEKYKNKKSINFSFNEAARKAEEWTTELNRKNKDIEDSGKVEEILDLGDGFKLVRLVDQASKNWEGLKMRSCISSYTEHQGIYSIRDKYRDPKCTIEIKDNKINQIKGKANSKIKPAYFDYVWKSLDYFNLEILDTDLKNIGYLPLRGWMKESFINLKIKKISNEEFFYTENKLILSKKPVYNTNLFLLMCHTGQSIDYIKGGINSCSINPSLHANTPLDIASRNGHLEVVKILLKDPRVNPSDASSSCIISASKNNHLDVVKELLRDKRADPSTIGNMTIINALTNGNLNMVRELIKDDRVDKNKIKDFTEKLLNILNE